MPRQYVKQITEAVTMIDGVRHYNDNYDAESWQNNVSLETHNQAMDKEYARTRSQGCIGENFGANWPASNNPRRFILP